MAKEDAKGNETVGGRTREQEINDTTRKEERKKKKRKRAFSLVRILSLTGLAFSFMEPPIAWGRRGSNKGGGEENSKSR